jgi:Protein of unknown function (DUF4058)
MKSPFPGMDPYIEGTGRWEDFHAKYSGPRKLDHRLSYSGRPGKG